MAKRRNKQQKGKAGKPIRDIAPRAPAAPSAPNKAEPPRSRKAAATAEHLAAPPGRVAAESSSSDGAKASRKSPARPSRPARPDRPQQTGARSRPARASSSPGQPGSWRFALEMSASKLALARFAIFAVLALDAILQVAHAGRYGAGGFNVPHLPGLFGPGREAYLFGQCLVACLGAMVAVGVGGRAAPIAMSLVYGWCYFGSQLDSYQHHYLSWLLITLWCFVPPPSLLGEAREGAAASSSSSFPSPTVRSAALRLVLLQLGILYLWAAISKLEPKWLDGTALSMQIGGLVRELIDATVGIKIASRLVVVAELGLAVTIWRARAWRWALPLGVGLHASIAVSGLEIGVFAYLMLAVYLLVVPEAWLAPLWRGSRTSAFTWLSAAFGRGHRGVCAALLILSAALLVVQRPPFAGGLPGALLIALVVIPAVLVFRWRLEPVRRLATRLALAAALALSLFFVVDRVAAVSVDYHRYWGGAARRLGAPAEAERAYRQLVAVDPALELAHFQLGRLLVRRGALEEGLTRLREAERLEPTRTRALDEQVRALSAAGRQDEARAAAARAKQRRDAAGSSAAKPKAPGGPAEKAAEPDDDERDEDVESEPAR